MKKLAASLLGICALSGCMMNHSSSVRIDGQLASDVPRVRMGIPLYYVVCLDARVNGKNRSECEFPDLRNSDRFTKTIFFKDLKWVTPWDNGQLSVRNVRLSAYASIGPGTVKIPLKVAILKKELDRNGGAVQIELQIPD